MFKTQALVFMGSTLKSSSIALSLAVMPQFLCQHMAPNSTPLFLIWGYGGPMGSYSTSLYTKGPSCTILTQCTTLTATQIDGHLIVAIGKMLHSTQIVSPKNEQIYDCRFGRRCFSPRSALFLFSVIERVPYRYRRELQSVRCCYYYYYY